MEDERVFKASALGANSREASSAKLAPPVNTSGISPNDDEDEDINQSEDDYGHE